MTSIKGSSGERGPQNPYERYGMDPLEGPPGITERMRELAEAADERGKSEIRAAWEELTLHPRRRFRAALAAHPESRPPLTRPARTALAHTPIAARSLTLGDLRLCPGIEASLGPIGVDHPPVGVPLDQDRILHEP